MNNTKAMQLWKKLEFAQFLSSVITEYRSEIEKQNPKQNPKGKQIEFKIEFRVARIEKMEDLFSFQLSQTPNKAYKTNKGQLPIDDINSITKFANATLKTENNGLTTANFEPKITAGGTATNIENFMTNKDFKDEDKQNFLKGIATIVTKYAKDAKRMKALVFIYTKKRTTTLKMKVKWVYPDLANSYHPY
jgi:hemerythrin superfamily protein